MGIRIGIQMRIRVTCMTVLKFQILKFHQIHFRDFKNRSSIFIYYLFIFFSNHKDQNFEISDILNYLIFKWCMKGICQSTGLVLTLSNGYWSDWTSEYSPCTRSCGGGVQFISRHCTHPK